MFTKRIAMLLILLIALAFFLVEFTVIRSYTLGYYYLNLEIECEPGQIRSVRWIPQSRPILTPRERILDDSISLDRNYEFTDKSDPYDGKPLKVTVNKETSDSPLGRTVNWWQDQSLVILVEMQDGRKIEKIVPIPDGRTTQTMTVSIR